MEQRIFIALAIIALGVIAYAVFKLWHRRSVGDESSLPPGWKAGVPGVLYFGSVNCAPCGPQRRAVEVIGLMENVNAVKINVDEEPEAAKSWNVLSLPTTFVLDGGGVVREVNHGAVSEKKLRRQLERVTSGSDMPQKANVENRKAEGAAR